MDELTWKVGHALADSPTSAEADPPPEALVRLGRLQALREVRDHASELIDADAVTLEGDHGIPQEDIAAALGVSRPTVSRMLRLARQGGGVVVVISRRDRVRHVAGDSRGRVGEVGGPGQYDADRRLWPVGAAVRERARYAVVAVDGTVRRVYALDPDGWSEAEPGRWEFTAVDRAPLDDAAVEAAVRAGELPLGIGDDCPTRVGGAYRPHWF